MELKELQDKIAQAKKTLEEINNQCNVKKREFDNYRIEEGKKKKHEERTLSETQEKIQKAASELSLKTDLLISLNSKVLGAEKKFASLNSEVKRIQIDQERLRRKEVELNLITSEYFGKKRELDNRSKDLEILQEKIGARESLNHQTSLRLSEKQIELDLRDVDLRTREENALDLLAQATEISRRADEELATAQKNKEFSAERLSQAGEILLEANNKSLQSDNILSDAREEMRKAEERMAAAESLEKSLRSYSKELDYKKLNIDAILQRKNIDEKQLGRK